MSTWVDKLCKQYNGGKRKLVAYREKLEGSQNPVYRSIEVDRELELVDGMISDLQYGINYMRLGRRPGAMRGIDRRAAYQRTVVLDTELFPSLMIEPEQHEKLLSDEEKKKLADVLWKLSAREKHCFLLHMAYGLSIAEVGKELKLSKASTQKYIDRARAKVHQGI